MEGPPASLLWRARQASQAHQHPCAASASIAARNECVCTKLFKTALTAGQCLSRLEHSVSRRQGVFDGKGICKSLAYLKRDSELLTGGAGPRWLVLECPDLV